MKNSTIHKTTISLQKFWIKNFWTQPNNFWALKVTLCLAAVLIPAVILGKPFIGSTLGLGAVAMSLTETDVHPKAKLKSGFATLLGYFAIAVFVELLFPFPWFFGIFYFLFVFLLTIFGGINFRFAGITFGSILLSIYAILGLQLGKPWYWQPAMLTAGAAIYATISLVISYSFPYRVLEEQMALGYAKLAEYFKLKSNLFPSTQDEQEKLRINLAIKNIDVSKSVNLIKQDLNDYAYISKEKPFKNAKKYYNQWYMLQELQRRATSSHEDYNFLSKNTGNPLLIAGIGQLLLEIGNGIQHYANCLLTGKKYEQPIRLRWATDAVQTMFQKYKATTVPSLALLIKNVQKSEEILNSLEEADQINFEENLPEIKAPKYAKLKKLLNLENPRFRFAVRLSICLISGYVLMNLFEFAQGAWIMLTSLIVCQQTYSATRQRLFHRVSGTLIGVVAGVSLAKLLPTTTGQILILLISVFAFFYFVRRNYTIAAIFITIFVLESFNIQSNTGIAVMIPRIIDTLVGAILAYLVVYFLWPDWQFKKLPELVRNAVKRNQNYFESVYKPTDYNDFLHNQRTANNADNELTTTWQGMRLEPKSKRKFLKTAYNLTYYNHTLLSYISAFAIHNFNKVISDEENAFCIEIYNLFEQLQTPEKELLEKIDGVEIQIQNLIEKLQLKREEKPEKSFGLLHNIVKVLNEMLWERIEYRN